MSSKPIVHRTSAPSSPTSTPKQPWHTHLTLDLLVTVLTKTLFHPFIASLLPICLRALAAPYTSTSFIVTSVFAASVCLYHLLASVNTRLAYGKPRDLNWENEVVVITGGAGGLGGCIAEIYSMRGVSVAILDISIDDTKTGSEEEGVHHFHCDVSDTASIKHAWDKVVESVGTPTILINNAAIVNSGLLLEAKMSKIEHLFRVNTISHFQLSQLFLQPLLKRRAGGTLVTVSSVLGTLGASNLSAYSASKAALLAYHASLSAELASTAPQIKTILATPGQMDTQLFRDLKVQGWLQNFIGPVVKAGDLAMEIVKRIDRGEGGSVSLPAYARWVAWLQVLPVGLQALLRRWSRMDDALIRSQAPAIAEEPSSREEGFESTDDLGEDSPEGSSTDELTQE